MGDKIMSKRIAKQAQVSIIPGFDGVIENEEHCIKIANQIGNN
jgi:propionyl-CoA carboxylase alpha chain